jgi:thiamine phosphate synthase YjbQ (UPF0047 family)
MFALQSFSIEVETTTGVDILDLTPQLAEEVQGLGVTGGLTLVIPGSGAALTTSAFETDAGRHLPAAFLKPSLSLSLDQSANG